MTRGHLGFLFLPFKDLELLSSDFLRLGSLHFGISCLRNISRFIRF